MKISVFLYSDIFTAVPDDLHETVEEYYRELVDDLHDGNEWFTFRTPTGSRTVRTSSVEKILMEATCSE